MFPFKDNLCITGFLPYVAHTTSVYSVTEKYNVTPLVQNVKLVTTQMSWLRNKEHSRQMYILVGLRAAQTKINRKSALPVGAYLNVCVSTATAEFVISMQVWIQCFLIHSLCRPFNL